MPIARRVLLGNLEVRDERAMESLPIYRSLKSALRDGDVRFLLTEDPIDHADAARVLNLAFWDPATEMEVLSEPSLSADQLAHNAWHFVVHRGLGEAANSPAGLLLAESIASASDLYWVGSLIGEVGESEFLETQVPAMSDAAFAAGYEESVVEEILHDAAQSPASAFESLRELLFDTAYRLYSADGIEDAAEILREGAEHPMGALLHHYEISRGCSSTAPTRILKRRSRRRSLLIRP